MGQFLAGKNDLVTTNPELAKQAYGWDPSKISTGSHKKLTWKCSNGHLWEARPNDRTGKNKNNCPICANKKLLTGYNDLKTLHPEIAKEADGWDPSLILSRSNKKLPWKCKEGHLWRTRVFERTKQQGTGCPECAESGFDPGKPAWFYLMRRENEQQIGITNNINQRIKFHRQKGLEKVDVVGPYLGKTVLNTETEIKRWIKSNIGLVPGKTENWYINKLEIKSLNELNEKCGLSAEIFN